MWGWVKSGLPLSSLVLIALIAFGALLAVEGTEIERNLPYLKEQQEAAEIMFRALEETRALRSQLGVGFDREIDPNQTGLIGEEFTILTTSLGNLQAKRTSTNPAFAALMVRYFKELGLEKGDVAAVGASGSFPALIIATLAAARALDLTPLLIYSFGASMYGANIPGFTLIEVLSNLREKGVLPYLPIAVSAGGEEDRAELLVSRSSEEEILGLIRGYSLPLIYEEELEESIKRRLELYREAAGGKQVKCFVNIGGASANYGDTSHSLSLPNGVIRGVYTVTGEGKRGLIFEYLIQGVPVVHLLNIRELALENGLPIDPVPLPPVGAGGVYLERSYRKVPTLLALGIIILAIIISVILRGGNRQEAVPAGLVQDSSHKAK